MMQTTHLHPHFLCPKRWWWTHGRQKAAPPTPQQGRRKTPITTLRTAAMATSCLLAQTFDLALPLESPATTYYVRQTLGSDANDGLTPDTAWQHVANLSTAMHAGDTAYVGPGLYRDEIQVQNDGTPEGRITFIADTTGQHTGDPPGVVMLTGAEPVDETIFQASDAPGVYEAPFAAFPVLGVVEMDGPQSRYVRAGITEEYHVEKMSELDVVKKRAASYLYDQPATRLYIHTSDGKPPAMHEIELFRRLQGILVEGRQNIAVIGFTFRHMGDSGIRFFQASSSSAINNVSYGSRQGIRAYEAKNILVYGNTLFRNENSGVYFGKESVAGSAIGNITYENDKGIRWGYNSVDGIALDNASFDNHLDGIAIETADRVIIRRNRLVNNDRNQLLVFKSEFSSESNCFENKGPEQMIVEFFATSDRYRSLTEYQGSKRQDMHSRDGDCGLLPAKANVDRLHAEALAYTQRARNILSGRLGSGAEGTSGPTEGPGGGIRGWLGWASRWFARLLGR